ncbi:ferritin-like domain-containing protein [Geopsychrobacter electrodiphilus]|uniref:ferritin-like domain-containing protein n=1 Tax=Geopsychrobacter electrodiphilus TaxID=225196 RepID=UPI000367C70E|nr:ferritin family protein [Geopsychrobacter electrodiphilus]
MNVFDYAMKMEADGKAYYQKLASQTDLPGLQTIFSRLAEDEQIHYQIFKKLKEGKGVPEVPESLTLKSVRNIFEALPLPEKAIKNIAGTLEAYQHAMQVEAESFRFYEKAAEEEGNPQIKKVLLQIAAEEQKHFNIMENIYHFTNAPTQYLAGAEVSDIDGVRQFGRDIES